MSSQAEKTVVTSCTRDCPDTCGMVAVVRDGRLVELRGNPDHPVTRGFLCRRSRGFIDRVYSPSRVTTPLRKVDGEWRRIPWDDALALMAEKLSGYRDQFGSLSILHYQEAGSIAALKMLNQRFFNLFGGVTTASGTLCGGAGIAGQTMDFGLRTAHEVVDVPNSRVILLWGRNPATTNVHMVPFLKEARQNGTTVVLIDPIKTRTAEMCDVHCQPLPGSDGYLAAAMAKVILDEGLVDEQFVAEHTEGFKGFTKALESLSLEELSGNCGIELPMIRHLAIMYAQEKPSAIWPGWGLQRREYGAEIFRMLDALAAITGNIGVAGGGVSHGMDEQAYWDWSLAKPNPKAVSRSIPRPVLGQGILDTQDPPIKAIVVTGGNPINQHPGSLKLQEAFRQTEFVVVVDSMMTDTADTAHLFLPATTSFEEEDLVGCYSHHFVGPVNPAIDPVGEARSDLQIFQALAERMGMTGMEGTTAEWLRRLAAPLDSLGVTLEMLREGPVRHPTAPVVPFEDRLFPTPSGRFRFTDMVPPNPATERPKGSFALVSSHPERRVHSQLLPEEQSGPVAISMSPADASELGLAEGAAVVLKGGEGRLAGRIELSPSLARGVLHCEEGGWIKLGAGVNQITPESMTRQGLCAAFYEAIVTIE